MFAYQKLLSNQNSNPKRDDWLLYYCACLAKAEAYNTLNTENRYLYT